MISEQKLFDLGPLQQMGNQDFIAEVVNLYIHDTDTDLQEMQSSLNEGAMDAVSGTAHKLKSSTGMLQADPLFTVFEQIEHMAKAGENDVTIARLVQIAQDEFNRLKMGLELHLLKIRMPAW